MEDSVSDEGRSQRKKELQKMIRSRLTTNQRVLLTLFDITMIAMIMTDLAYFVGFLKKCDLLHLVLLNLTVVVVAYISYKMKQRIGKSIVKEIFRKRKDESTGENEEE